MKKILYTLLLSAITFVSMAQESAVNTKDAADMAYSEARYGDAIAIYESLLAGEGASLQLYYNLGNAYYRNGQPGKAILNYERALKIDPYDEDCKANLEFVQERITDKVPHDDVPFYTRWANSLFSILSKNAWANTGVVTFILMLISLFFFFFKQNVRKTTLILAIVCLIFTIIANVAAYKLHNRLSDAHEAVILDEMVLVKSSPDSSGVELTRIHEGLKVKVIDNTLKEWVRIEANNGNRVVGWVKSKSLETI